MLGCMHAPLLAGATTQLFDVLPHVFLCTARTAVDERGAHRAARSTHAY